MLTDKKLFLFDIDGVIKLGDTLIDGALDLYDYIRLIGGKFVMITNNSTKGTADYVKEFHRFGFEDLNESNFMTALTVTVDYLEKTHKNDLIFVSGTKSFLSELQRNGLNVTDRIVEGIDAVLLGYDNELTYRKICDVCEILQTQEVDYLATNLDLRCPMPFGFVPDCGAIADFIAAATERKPKFLGKPSPEIVCRAMQKNGFEKFQTLVIGDRLYTDIACGVNAGVETCIVFSGEAKAEDLKDSAIRPDYRFESVKELFEALKDRNNGAGGR